MPQDNGPQIGQDGVVSFGGRSCRVSAVYPEYPRSKTSPIQLGNLRMELADFLFCSVEWHMGLSKRGKHQFMTVLILTTHTLLST